MYEINIAEERINAVTPSLGIGVCAGRACLAIRATKLRGSRSSSIPCSLWSLMDTFAELTGWNPADVFFHPLGGIGYGDVALLQGTK